MHARLSVVLVSVYLFLVAAWLVLTRQVAAPGIGKILRSAMRPRRYRGELASVRAESGHCWLADVPDTLLSDKDSASRLRVFEDGKALGPAHAGHDEVRTLGLGRYSHWGDTLYFSTSDNSDPRTNGRRYTVSE